MSGFIRKPVDCWPILFLLFIFAFFFAIGFFSGEKVGTDKGKLLTQEEALSNNAGYWLFEDGEQRFHWGPNPNFTRRKQ